MSRWFTLLVPEALPPITGTRIPIIGDSAHCTSSSTAPLYSPDVLWRSLLLYILVNVATGAVLSEDPFCALRHLVYPSARSMPKRDSEWYGKM